METCESLTHKNHKCSKGATYCIAHNGEVKNFCTLHVKSTGLRDDDLESIANPDYYYDEKRGRFIVNKISRVPHDKLTNLPTRYTEGLTDKQKLKYLKEIEETRDIYKKTGKVVGRERVSRSLSPQRSHHTENFEKRYGFSVADTDKVKKYFPDTDVDTILSKGRAAYASGSRPSVSGSSGPYVWANARLASVLTGGKALAVDKDLVGPKSLKKIFN
jgi:hypothetical protein